MHIVGIHLDQSSGEGQSRTFVQAGILAGASIVVRIIGLLYRSPLTAIIGDEGNGYYGLAYNIYTIVLLISSYSIPSAISKIMAEKLALEHYKSARRVFFCALFYALAAGLAASLFLFFAAPVLVPATSVPVLRVFAPTIFIFGILGVLRGFFQAHRTMMPTSVSQILEQLANAIVSIAAAWLLIQTVKETMPSKAPLYGAIGSALGTGAGVLIALLFMAWCYLVNVDLLKNRIYSDKTEPESYRSIMIETVRNITPFIMSSFILNLTTSLNQTIYIKMMINTHGADEIAVTTMYGLFSNKAVVITNIPISIATAVSAAIIPGISTAFARGDLDETRSRCRNANRMTFLIAMPCTIGLMAFAWPVTLLLFPQMMTLETASSLLAVLSITVVFYSVSTVTNAVLQGIGRMHMPLVSAGIALVIQTVLLVLLVRYSDMGIYSLVLVSIIYSILIFVFNTLFIRKYLKVRGDVLGDYALPLLASMIMGVGSITLYIIIFKLASLAVNSLYFVNVIAVFPSILVAVMLYFFVLIRFGVIGTDDFLALPKGRFIVRVLRRLRWI
ncbi:MAG: polysaccharide biosynthesis protein [Lachnospiraceae bacterium]|nr:polysaccharide biosynthesis protein [Lachnospiraceae bacterium]